MVLSTFCVCACVRVIWNEWLTTHNCFWLEIYDSHFLNIMISNSLQARSAILLRFAGARGFTSNFSQSWGRMICGCWDSRVLFVSSFANITTSRSLRSYSLSGVITMANQNKNHHGGTDQNFSLHIHTPTTPLLRCPSPAQLVSMAPPFCLSRVGRSWKGHGSGGKVNLFGWACKSKI